jgi:two-component system heavy metal sensor histidine kinase CusS
MKVGSLSLRLALWVGLLGLLQAGAVLLFSYLTLSHALDQQQRGVLRDKAEHARHLLDSQIDGAAVAANASQFLELVTGHAELHLMVARPDGEAPLLFFSPEARESLFRLKRDVWSSDASLQWRMADQRSMLSLARAARTVNGESYEIVVTADRSKDEQLLSGMLFTSFTAAPFGLALVCVSAMAIVTIGLRPLNRFSRVTAHITANNLSTRLDETDLPEELRSLAVAFNAMLNRLDEGVQRLSEFSSDLAHELRTPLATLLGRTQLALSKPRNNEDLVDVLVGNVEDLQRMSLLVDDMLFLAQTDDAKAALHRVDLDLADEARKLVDFMELLALERGIAIDVSGHARVAADRQHVRRMITNLLSNALRHGRTGSVVRVHAFARGDSACIDVANDGDSISPEHQERLFDRFYRVDSSRARDSGGSGLGLAIVRAIMKLHGGTVDVASDGAGTCFTLCFPGRAAKVSSCRSYPAGSQGTACRSANASERIHAIERVPSEVPSAGRD